MPNELSKKTYPDGTEVFYRDDTAREQISNISTVKTGTFIKDSSQSGASVNLSIRQVGKVVSIQGFISGLVVGGTTIGKISGVDAPPVTLRTLANSTNQAWETGDSVYTVIGTDGTMDSRITKPVLNISITYIA